MIGQAMRGFAEMHDLKQWDVAKALGVSQSTISEWYAGKSMPPFDKAVEFCDLCKVNVLILVHEAGV